MEHERARALLQTARAVRNPVIELRELKLRGATTNTNGSGVYVRRSVEGAGVYVGGGTVERAGRK